MSSAVTQCVKVCFCMPMPFGMPGMPLMSISIVVSYWPSFTLPFIWSNGPAASARVETRQKPAATRCLLLMEGVSDGSKAARILEYKAMARLLDLPYDAGTRCAERYAWFEAIRPLGWPVFLDRGDPARS